MLIDLVHLVAKRIQMYFRKMNSNGNSIFLFSIKLLTITIWWQFIRNDCIDEIYLLLITMLWNTIWIPCLNDNKRFNIVLEILQWIDEYEQIDLLLVEKVVHWQIMEDVDCFLKYVLKAYVESLWAAGSAKL